MTRSTIFWATALVCTAAAFGARAQDVSTPSAPTIAPGPAASTAPPAADDDKAALQRLDKNSDGKVTKAEAQADGELARRFSELDTDNSGKLDQAEFARFEVGAAAAGSDAR